MRARGFCRLNLRLSRNGPERRVGIAAVRVAVVRQREEHQLRNGTVSDRGRKARSANKFGHVEGHDDAGSFRAGATTSASWDSAASAPNSRRMIPTMARTMAVSI